MVIKQTKLDFTFHIMIYNLHSYKICYNIIIYIKKLIIHQRTNNLINNFWCEPQFYVHYKLTIPAAFYDFI